MNQGHPNKILLVILFLLFNSLSNLYAQDANEELRMEIFSTIDKGQYVQARDRIKELIVQKEKDRKFLGEIFCLTSKPNQQPMVSSAVEILRVLDWRRPYSCSGEGNDLKHMLDKGMNKEVDLTLTRGTALVNDHFSDNDYTGMGGCRTDICPERANLIFSFWSSNPSKIKEVIQRYEDEIKKRPDDVRLLVEYAYQVSMSNINERASELLASIDLNKMKSSALLAVGTLGSAEDPVWVPFQVKALEQFLSKPYTDEEATQSDSIPQQAMAIPSESKVRKRQNALEELGKRYTYLKRYADAVRVYKEYQSFPRKERWDDRSGIEKSYSEVLKMMGIKDEHEDELLKKAKDSTKAEDWAELASYYQGQGKIDQAKSAWLKTIELTPPDPQGFKVELKKRGYRWALAKMLNENHRYDEEVQVWKEALVDVKEVYEHHSILKNIALALLNAGKKSEALEYLLSDLDKTFDIQTLYLVLATDHEQELREGYGVTTQNVKKLPSWQAVMEKILRLPKTDQVKALKSLYSRFNFYKEYVAVVEASGEISKDFQTMNTLRDAYERIGRLDQSIFLGKEILKKSDEKGFPSQGSQEYRRILADISEYLARSGDFQSSLEYAQKATLIYPEVYYFAQELAKLALKENKRAILIKAFEELAKANPKEWGPWQVMAIIYKEWEDSANQTRCEQKATELK